MTATEILNTEEPAPPPLSKVERLLPPEALAIIAHQERMRDDSMAKHDAHQARQKAIDTTIAELQGFRLSNNDHPKPNKKLEEQYARQLDLKYAERRENQRRYDEDAELQTGSAMSFIDTFISNDLKGPMRFVGTTDTLADGVAGQRDMMDLLRTELAELTTKRKEIKAAPLTAAEIRGEVISGVNKAQTTLKTAAQRARRVNYIEHRNRFEKRGFQFPEIRLVDGLGTIMPIGNALGVLCSVFESEIIEYVTALALEGHDESTALDMATRHNRLREIDAEILTVERRSEFWVRQCQAAGINAGPRLTSNVLAILDIEPA